LSHICLWCEVWIKLITITVYGCQIVPVSFVEKTILSPLNCCYSFVKNQLTIYLQVYLWTLFYSIDLFAYLDTNVTLSWFLSHRSVLHFHMNLKINLSISLPAQKSHGIFIGIAYTSQSGLRVIDILRTLILLIHEHTLSHYLFGLSSF
jgi:hypothetical protein